MVEKVLILIRLSPSLYRKQIFVTTVIPTNSETQIILNGSSANLETVLTFFYQRIYNNNCNIYIITLQHKTYLEFTIIFLCVHGNIITNL